MITRSYSYLAVFLLLSSAPLVSQSKITPGVSAPKVQKQPNPPTETALPEATKPSTAPTEILKVTINSSRVSVTRDGSYGVYADLENLSQTPVSIRAPETMLVVQPEVAYPIACVGVERGIFPAQPFSGDPSKNSEMIIQPQEHYKVFWNLTNTSGKDPYGRCAESSWRKGIGEYLGFVPGDYAFTVEGIVYVPNPKSETIVAHTYTETTTLHVGLSQVSTAVAAFIGALLAYLVVALQPGQAFDKWKLKAEATAASVSTGPLQLFNGWVRSAAIVLRNALAAGLLGAALTIVASRLSDTQFPIKVSVNDFWGALTIGFVSYFIGGRLLTTIVERFAPKPGGDDQTGAPGVGTSGTGKPPALDKPDPATSESSNSNVTPKILDEEPEYV